MSKKFKFLGLVLMALLLVVGVGAGSASADHTVAALTITSSGALTLEGAAASAITVGALNTGGISIGGGNTAKTINLGTGTAIDTINIGTGATGVDVIRIGQAAAVRALTDANWSVTTAGLFTTASNISVTDGEVGATKSRATDATGSFQPIWGDLTYVGAAGGTSTYHAGVMGNFMGDTLSNAGSDIHAGVVGKYSVTTSDALTGAKAGLVGEVETSVGDAAVMAVLGGDTSAITPGAAYGVVYLNSTAGSHFNYGLDLYHAATTDYGAPSAVDYGTADIRLSSGVKISTGLIAAIPATCTAGDIYIATDGGDDGIIRACEATNDWDSVGTPAD